MFKILLKTFPVIMNILNATSQTFGIITWILGDTFY